MGRMLPLNIHEHLGILNDSRANRSERSEPERQALFFLRIDHLHPFLLSDSQTGFSPTETQ